MDQQTAQNLVQEAFNKIIILMQQDKWLEAHRACVELLRFDPENIKAIRLKYKIEKNVKKINQNAIKNDLKALKQFWKEQDYTNLLFNLKKLEPYINDYPPLKKIFAKAQNLYNRQLEQKQHSFYQDQLSAIRRSVENKKFKEAFEAAESLKKLNIFNDQTAKVIININHDWIEYELEQNKTLCNSDKFEDILLFYQKLLKIDPKSEKLKKLMASTKDRYAEYKIAEKREFIYTSLEKIRTLYQLNKFDRVMDACGEVLEIDPKNKEVLHFYKSAKRKAANSIDKEVIQQIKNSQQQLKSDYQKDKTDYLKI